jgi:hypothetical protein
MEPDWKGVEWLPNLDLATGNTEHIENLRYQTKSLRYACGQSSAPGFPKQVSVKGSFRS